MKTILYVFPKLSAGGAEKAAIIVSNYLIRQYDYKVSFFVLYSGVHYKNLLDPSIEIVGGNIERGKTKIKQWFNGYIVFYFSLLQLVKKRNYDIIISGHEIDPELPIIQLILTISLFVLGKKTKYVSVIQSSLKNKHGQYHSSRNTLVLSIIFFLRNLLFDKIIVVSQSLLKQFHESIRHKISIIPNPIDWEDVVKQSKEDIKIDSHQQLTKPYFINVARIATQKNQLMLLKAFNIVKDQNDWNLLLIGAITEQNYYLQIINYIRKHHLDDRVLHLEPQINHFPYISDAKAFVFTSVYEGLSLAILEAMALGKIIVSTKYIGYSEILNDSNSVLVENDDVESYAASLLYVTRNMQTMELLTENYRKIMKLYDHAKISEQYYKVFQYL